MFNFLKFRRKFNVVVTHCRCQNKTFTLMDSVMMEKKWCSTLTDSNDIIIHLRTSYSSGLVFDVLYIAITNEKFPLPTNVFGYVSQSGMKIPLKNSLSGSKIRLLVYGLQKRLFNGEPFDEVVCFGESEITIKQQTNFQIDITLNKNMEIPVDSSYKVLHDVPSKIIRTTPEVSAVPAKSLDYEIPIDFPSATNVLCIVLATTRELYEKGKVYVSKTTGSSSSFTFKTYLNKDDIHSLFFLATKYGLRVGKPNLHPIRYIYRNKPDHYFNNIRFQRDGIMEPYLKSNGGEQGSVLNGRLKGLFFSTLVDPLTNMPYDFSYFGNIRLYVEASYLFHPNCNLYFSDFYCHTKRHHVTLVLTPKSSPTNELCRKYLLQLDILNNPYLHIFRYNDGSFCVLANMNVVVEIFYTDPIDISSLLEIGAGFMRRTPTKGRGYALPSGIPKNSSCVLCNLYR